MPGAGGGFLAGAVAQARHAAAGRARAEPLAALRHRAGALPAGRPLVAVRPVGAGPAVIAEVKRRSPAAGPIAPGLDPAVLAAGYALGGAAAVSVLTEPAHFGGSPEDLWAVRAAVDLPVLRKDFVTTEYQVWETRAWGADAVLLILAALTDAELGRLLATAADAELDALVEVHSAAEARRAVAAGATLVGVNARDLRTLELEPARFAAVRPELPAGIRTVAESGIRDRAGVLEAGAAGADAVLVGSALAGAADPAAAVGALLGRVSGKPGAPPSRRLPT